jgi:ABC-type uncharacterized transport system substrate-binding protein
MRPRIPHLTGAEMSCNCRALLGRTLLMFALGVPALPGLAAKFDVASQVHVGVVAYASASEVEALKEELLRELRARPERPAKSYRITALGITFTDDAATAAIDELKRLRIDIALLLSPMLVDKALQTLDRVPLVTTGQAFLSEMTYFASTARPGGRVTGFIRDVASFAKSAELLQSFCPSIRRVGALIGSDLSGDPDFVRYLAHENELLRGSGATIIPIYSVLDAKALQRIVRENSLDALSINATADVRTESTNSAQCSSNSAFLISTIW